MELATDATTTATEQGIANYHNPQSPASNKCRNTHKQCNKISNNKPTTKTITTASKETAITNKKTTKITIRKTITLPDKPGVMQETDREDTIETYASYAEKEATLKHSASN